MKKKDKKLSEEFVKRSIIQYLSKNGWGHFKFGGPRDHGVDIQARHTKYSRYFLIEVKGEGKIPQQNENHFVYSLGQIITRMKAGGSTRTYYALGLPTVAARIAIRRIPWQVSKKLLLYIFSVNEEGKVRQYTWKDLKEIQVKI
jgi:hypothetical protein